MLPLPLLLLPLSRRWRPSLTSCSSCFSSSSSSSSRVLCSGVLIFVLQHTRRGMCRSAHSTRSSSLGRSCCSCCCCCHRIVIVSSSFFLLLLLLLFCTIVSSSVVVLFSNLFSPTCIFLWFTTSGLSAIVFLYIRDQKRSVSRSFDWTVLFYKLVYKTKRSALIGLKLPSTPPQSVSSHNLNSWRTNK